MNGVEEKFYATTSFLVLDENNQQVTMSQLLEGYLPPIEVSGSTTNTGGLYNLVVSCTAYWDAKFDGSKFYARCTSTTNQVVGNAYGEYWVTKLDCAFKATNDEWIEETYIDEIFIDAPTPYFMYTVSNPNRDFFNISGHFSKVLAGVAIYYNTGEVYEVIIDIKDAVLGT